MFRAAGFPVRAVVRAWNGYPGWIYSRVTRRLAESVARLCQVLPIKHVAAFFGLGWDAVKAIDKRHLMDTLGAIDLSGVLHPGHG